MGMHPDEMPLPRRGEPIAEFGLKGNHAQGMLRGDVPRTPHQRQVQRKAPAHLHLIGKVYGGSGPSGKIGFEGGIACGAHPLCVRWGNGLRSLPQLRLHSGRMQGEGTDGGKRRMPFVGQRTTCPYDTYHCIAQRRQDVVFDIAVCQSGIEAFQQLFAPGKVAHLVDNHQHLFPLIEVGSARHRFPHPVPVLTTRNAGDAGTEFQHGITFRKVFAHGL